MAFNSGYFSCPSLVFTIFSNFAYVIEGLPTTIDPSTTYPLTVTITDTSPGGTAVRSGFQIVSLKQNLANAGTFAVAGSETNASVKMIAGKSYVGHQPSKNFDSNDEVVFEVEWTSPSSATGPITLYGASIIANGSNGNSNDKFVTNQAELVDTAMLGTMVNPIKLRLH